jgi:hypothetical protein
MKKSSGTIFDARQGGSEGVSPRDGANKMKPTITVADNGNLQIHIPMLIRRMRGRKTVIAPQALDGEIPGAQEPVQSAILQALGRAFSWADILESGQIKSISELARTLDVDGSYVARILKLTTLAPDIVEALINGEEPNGLSLAKLTQTFPEDWAEQRSQFGFATD